jgi:4-diphosphocytidyl-2-C-methyl-D-erythritol kinase
MAPISLTDTLRFEKQGRWIDFQCDDPSVPQNDENLVVQAAKKFFESTKTKGGVAIHLAKKIPHGAGLGGGSSDAASALIALNELFGTGLPRAALAGMGAAIGSDVPFFIFESAAMCRGRGELISPEPMKEQLLLLLVKPEFGVSTPWAYSKWQESREIPEVQYASQKFAGYTFGNDLERPVLQKFVFLATIKMWLLKQPEVGAALMSGSGSTVFAVLKKSADANGLTERARKELDPKLWVHACSTL